MAKDVVASLQHRPLQVKCFSDLLEFVIRVPLQLDTSKSRKFTLAFETHGLDLRSPSGAYSRCSSPSVHLEHVHTYCTVRRTGSKRQVRDWLFEGIGFTFHRYSETPRVSDQRNTMLGRGHEAVMKFGTYQLYILLSGSSGRSSACASCDAHSRLLGGNGIVPALRLLAPKYLLSKGATLNCSFQDSAAKSG